MLKKLQNKIIPRTFVIMMLINSVVFYIVLAWSLLGNKSHKQTSKWHSDQNIEIFVTRLGLGFIAITLCMIHYIICYIIRNNKR